MDFGWLWIIVIVASVIVEICTDQLLTIWFVPAGIVCVLLDFFKVDFLIQLFVFFALSLIGILVLRRLFNLRKKDNTYKTNIDAIVGEKCIVTEKIDNFAGCGQAKVKGQIWSARGVLEDDVFEEGEILTVVAIEGVKLICKKEK